MKTILELIPTWKDEQLRGSLQNAIKAKTAAESENASPKVKENAVLAEQVLEAIENRWRELNELYKQGKYMPVRPKDGPLSEMGYHVGKNGEPTAKRRIILDRAYRNHIPLYFGPIYAEGWGEPETELRLQKIANSLAYFVRDNKKYNDDNRAKAIIEWQEDLDWLKKTYYDQGRCTFKWPH